MADTQFKCTNLDKCKIECINVLKKIAQSKAEINSLQKLYSQCTYELLKKKKIDQRTSNNFYQLDETLLKIIGEGNEDFGNKKGKKGSKREQTKKRERKKTKRYIDPHNLIKIIIEDPQNHSFQTFDKILRIFNKQNGRKMKSDLANKIYESVLKFPWFYKLKFILRFFSFVSQYEDKVFRKPNKLYESLMKYPNIYGKKLIIDYLNAYVKKDFSFNKTKKVKENIGTIFEKLMGDEKGDEDKVKQDKYEYMLKNLDNYSEIYTKEEIHNIVDEAQLDKEFLRYLSLLKFFEKYKTIFETKPDDITNQYKKAKQKRFWENENVKREQFYRSFLNPENFSLIMDKVIKPVIFSFLK